MADTLKYVAGKEYTLYGSGITATATSLVLSSFTDRYGNLLTMSDFGTIGYLSLEPGTSKFEIVSFTGVTQNADGTATITGLTRGLKFKAPYDADTNLRQQHSGSASVKISNPPQLYDRFPAKDNDETITGDYTFTGRAPSIPTETSSDTGRAASIGYVNNAVTAGGVDASTTVKGISKLSTAPASATNPIAVGDNDPRVPTQAENDAIAGNSGTAVSGSNKLVDNADTATTSTASKVVRALGSGKIDTSWIQEKFGGDGSDGALNISSGTTTLDAAGAKILIKNYTSISITGTGKITVSNPHAGGTILVLRSQGNVTLTSSVTVIDLKGLGASEATNPNYLIGSAAPKGITASSGSGGAAGAAFDQTDKYAIDSANALYRRTLHLACGAGGGAGMTRTGAGGAGGRGGGALLIECGGAFNFTTGTVDVSGNAGSNGANSDDAGGGGGGGSCGMALVLYNSLTANTGTFTATGGAGGTSGTSTGSGANDSAGGGGGGGSFVAAGGAGGTNNNTGSNAAGLGAGGGGGGSDGVAGNAAGGSGGGSAAATVCLVAKNNYF